MNTGHRFILVNILLVLFAITDLAPAQTWRQTSAPSNNWSFVACSADGAKLFASASGEPATVYSSVDSGDTWTPTSMSGYIFACSADAGKVVTWQGIYAAADSTWSLVGHFPTDFIRLVALSGDGNKIAALGDGKVYTSTNSGATWTSNTPPTSLTVLASSADGAKLVGGGGTLGVIGFMAASADSGTTWNLLNLPYNWWRSIASSADGSTLAAYGYYSGLMISTNSGATWTSSNPGMYGTDVQVVSSADGRKLVAYGYGIFASSDSGQTWVSNNVPPEIFWTSAASSADGHKLVATGYRSTGTTGIWISQSIPAPQLRIARETTNLSLSWIVPSTPFVLQKSSRLISGNWTDVVATPTLNFATLRYELTLSPPSSVNRFYRLKY